MKRSFLSRIRFYSMILLVGVMTTTIILSGQLFAIGEVIRIYDIQGSAQKSPLENETATTRGIVTVIKDDGFFFQDSEGDGNVATSDGVFARVEDVVNVTAGDDVNVEGQVLEVAPQGGLTTTQILVSDVQILSSDNDLPTPIQIGEAVPSSVGVVDFYERLEGMLVALGDTVGVVDNVQPNRIDLAVADEDTQSFEVASDGSIVLSDDEDVAIGEATPEASDTPSSPPTRSGFALTATANVENVTLTAQAREEQATAEPQATATPTEDVFALTATQIVADVTATAESAAEATAIPTETVEASPQPPTATSLPATEEPLSPEEEVTRQFIESSSGPNTSDLMTYFLIAVAAGLFVYWWRRR